MYVKNVLMDENEGLYIDLTDLNTRLDNIHKPHHNGTDEVPTPEEETQNVSVLWGPVGLGETATFYAWQACYYTYETETVSYTQYLNVYNDTFLTGSTSDSAQTDYFWRGLTEIVVNTQECGKHGDWCYAYEGGNDTISWTGNHPMTITSFYGTEVKSYPGGLANPKTGIVDSTLTIDSMTADTTRWKVIVKNTEKTTNIKIHRILVKDAIIYTTSLPSYTPDLYTSTVNFHRDLAHPFDITNTAYYVNTSSFDTVSKLASGFDIINAVNMQNFYIKTVADIYTNSIGESFFYSHYVKISTVDGQPAALCTTADHRAYLSPNKDGSGTPVAEYAVDYYTSSIENILDTRRTVRSYNNKTLSFEATDFLGKTQNFTFLWDSDGSVTQSTDATKSKQSQWQQQILKYFSKEGRERDGGIYKYGIKQEGILKKNITSTIFSNTTFSSHIPVYVCDTTGMKMLCTFTESQSQSVNGVTKNVAHFMPATNATKVYLKSTESNPGLRSTIPTNTSTSSFVAYYGGFKRMPYYDKKVPLKGVYITSSLESLPIQDINSSTTDPYHLYYATKDTSSEYKNVVNAKGISSYGTIM
jgi:hypothetical protein